MISIYTFIAYMAWTIMLIVWMIGRIGNKKTLKIYNIKIYLLLYLSYALLFIPPLLGNITIQTKFLGLLGDILCFTGGSFAIWARLTLGKNWSPVATQKKEHKLVTNGPYKLVRHPIYTGVLIAMLGFSMTIVTGLSFFAVIMGVISVLLRIQIEEKLMSSLFTNSYKIYSNKVKKLIPFIW